MGLVTRYIIDVQDTLRILLRQPVDKEMLHRFRVQVKKMKAIWAIHPIGNDIAFKRSFPKISKLYSLAASVRDKQMVLSCLESLPAFPQFPDLEKILNSSIKKHRKKFIENLKIRRLRYGVYEENRLFMAYFKVSSGTLLRQNRKEFKHHTIQMMQDETGKSPNELHKLRRQCKYLLFQCSAFHASVTNQDNGLKKESVEHLQHNMGEWHDWWNTVAWLNALEADEKKIMPVKSLQNQAVKKEELLRREVLKEIKTILHGIKMQPAG